MLTLSDNVIMFSKLEKKPMADNIKKPNADMIKGLRPIKKRTRDMEVLDALIEMIDLAGLKVGERLPPENEIAKSLNVGRSTVREALKTWQGMGIIVRNKGAGTILATEVSANSMIVPLSVRIEAESLFRTRSVKTVLDIEVSKLASINATELQKQNIMAKCDDLINDYEAGYDWRPADAIFHDAINDACGNPLFGQMIKQLHDVFHNIYESPLGQKTLGSASIPLHRDLAEYIIAGNGEKAGEITQQIADIVLKEVREIING